MKIKSLIGIVFLVLGLYCVNFGLSFYSVPYVTEDITNWVIAVVGAFAVFESLRYFKGKKEKGIFGSG